MTKITQKQLIEQVKGLKEIKPRQEWVSLLKSRIIAERQTENAFQNTPAKKAGILDILPYVFFQKKTAYAFATLVFLVVGVLGFAQYTMPGDALFPVKKLAEQSQANLMGQTTLNKEIANLSNRINDLAQVAKDGRKENIPSVIVEIKANASELAKNLKDNPVQDPQAMKEIATTLKTLASVAGTDLSENQGVKDLYQTVVSSQIADFEKATLTEEQKEILVEAKKLYEEEKYPQALEKILAISN